MATEQKTEGSQQTNGGVATEQRTEESQQNDAGNPVTRFAGKVEAKYRELKLNAETFPYVWASYGVVYGGFGLWFCYRWRKLRRTEDRVRALHERLRQLHQAEEAACAAEEAASAKANSTSAASQNASSSAPISKPPK